MTDNQFKEMMTIMTKCVTGIQNLREDVAELKIDVAGLKIDVAELKTDVAGLKEDSISLKEGQKRLEEGQAEIKKELQITNKVLAILSDESIRTRARVDILEKQRELSV